MIGFTQVSRNDTFPTQPLGSSHINLQVFEFNSKVHAFIILEKGMPPVDFYSEDREKQAADLVHSFVSALKEELARHIFQLKLLPFFRQLITFLETGDLSPVSFQLLEKELREKTHVSPPGEARDSLLMMFHQLRVRQQMKVISNLLEHGKFVDSDNFQRLLSDQFQELLARMRDWLMPLSQKDSEWFLFPSIDKIFEKLPLRSRLALNELERVQNFLQDAIQDFSSLSSLSEQEFSPENLRWCQKILQEWHGSLWLTPEQSDAVSAALRSNQATFSK